MVSKSRNKIHQTWGPPISRALYFTSVSVMVRPVSRLGIHKLDAEVLVVSLGLLGGGEVGAAELADQLPGEVGAAELKQAPQGIRVLK